MTADRFWSRLSSGPNSCWLWPGAHNGSGYGELKYDGRKVRAHRLAYELTFGPIPDGAHVLHECDTPACCNPAHLYLGDPKANAEDREQRRRGNHTSGETHARVKLTDAQVAEIRRRRAMGEVSTSIAPDFGVSASYVLRLARGQNRR